MGRRLSSPPGARDPFIARLEESKLKPFAPHIILGTPGASLGIELDFQQVDYHFYPFYDCPECGAQKPLHPKGCLLRPQVSEALGEKITKWYTESGKPRQWWHRDPNNPAKTAYVGCQECGAELSNDVRRNSVFRECRLNVKLEVISIQGRSLHEFLAALPPEAPTEYIRAGVVISPLLKEGNPALSIIERGINTKNPEDWQQQALGVTSEAGDSGISIEMIRRAINAPKPDKNPQVILAAMDQGRSEDWLWIAHLHLPDKWQSMKPMEIKEQSIREIVYADAINRQNLGQILKDYRVTFGVLDQEPDIPDSVKISQQFGLDLANQRSAIAKTDLERINREASGVQYHVWDIRQKDFQDLVLFNFSGNAYDGGPRYRLPGSWEKWLNLLGSEISPVTHLTSMVRDPETRIWVRPDDHNDDHFFAAMFLEVAIALWIKKHRSGRSVRTRAFY